MSREADKKIAEWLGWEDCGDGWVRYPDGRITGLPRYSTYDTAAITLLPKLVEKDYYPQLEANFQNLWRCQMWEPEQVGDMHYEYKYVSGDSWHKTIATAISSAVLELIEKEATND